MRRSISQPSHPSIFSWRRPISSMSLSRSSPSLGSAMATVISLKRSTRSCTGFIEVAQVFTDGLVEIELRFLGHVAHPHVLGQGGRAIDIGVDPGHDLQRVDFPAPFSPTMPILCAVVERQADILQHDVFAETLADIVHFEDELGRHELLEYFLSLAGRDSDCGIGLVSRGRKILETRNARDGPSHAIARRTRCRENNGVEAFKPSIYSNSRP